MNDNNNNTINENEVETKVKKTSKDKEIESLKAQIEQLTKLVAQMATPVESPKKNIENKTNDVTLVYMSDSEGVIQSGDLELICTRFGENFTVGRSQFDAIVGKYRKWFDIGILAVSPKDIEIAAAKGLKTSDEYSLSSDNLNKIGKMSLNEIEKLWNSVESETQKLTIVQFFKRKFIEGIEPGFQDRAKIELLNRLTDGGLKREAKEITGEELKIRPTEM